MLPHLQVEREVHRYGRLQYVAWYVFHPDGQGKPPHKPELYVDEKIHLCTTCGRQRLTRELLAQHMTMVVLSQGGKSSELEVFEMRGIREVTLKTLQVRQISSAGSALGFQSTLRNLGKWQFVLARPRVTSSGQKRTARWRADILLDWKQLWAEAWALLIASETDFMDGRLSAIAPPQREAYS